MKSPDVPWFNEVNTVKADIVSAPTPEQDDPWTRIRALQPFFARIPTDAPENLAAVLQPVAACEQTLWRRERQVTFFGAFKAGKSALLNALLGAPLLPVRANRATGVVTIVRYGPQASATVVRNTKNGRGEEEIPFDDMAGAILLDLAGNAAQAPEGIEEVRIRLPHPLLAERCVLVDTPGLLENETLTERSERELERSDLAVMVLSADKLLSTRERETARQIHDLLNGNIVYVLNRLDLVEENDRAEVLDWARTALQGSGNQVVGMPRIFAATAKRDHEGLAAFRRWLEEILTTPAGEVMAGLSRLGILEQYLCRVSAAGHAELAAAQQLMQQARDEEEAVLAQERGEIRARIASSRAGLQTWKTDLAALGETFVAGCVEETRQQIQGRGRAPETVRICYESSLEQYAADVAGSVRGIVLDLPLTAPTFELRQWILHAEVAAATHPTSELGALFGDLMTRVVDGGSAGREAGATIGGWIGKNVFGVDAELETLKRVEHVARGVLPSLQAEAERYLDQVAGLLAEADRFYGEWRRTGPRVAAAEEFERTYRGIVQWCDDFLQQVQAAASIVSAT